MTKTMIRINKNKNYVVLSKKGLEDIRLSWKAKGVLAYLLSLPDDWQIYIEELSRHSKDGIDSTTSAIKELIMNSYINRERLRNEKGQLKNYLYTVFEEPQIIDISKVNPTRENPVLENPKQENPRLLNNNKLNNNLTIEEEESIKKNVDEEVIKIYADCISKKISNYEYDILAELQALVGQVILIKAIKLSVERNGKNIGYIRAILNDWQEKGITTLDKVDEYLDNWIKTQRKAKENKTKQIKKRAEKVDYNTKVSNFNNFPQRDYDFEDLERKLLGWDNQ